MTEPIREPNDLSPVAREALNWVVRLRSGEATKGDLAALDRWRAQDPEHEAAFRRAAKLWRGMQRTAEGIKAEQARHRGIRLFGSGRGVMTRRMVVSGAAVAAAGAYAMFDPPLDLWPSLSELRADYRTKKGERREIDVAPGVAVTLSTLTSISVLPAERNNPRIELVNGEAAVTADRPAGRPVTLEASKVRAIASRATFNFRCIDGAVSVTCFAGNVDVEAPFRLVQLRAGQQVTATQTEGLSTAEPADLEQAGAWQKGLLVVSNKPLIEVVNEVNRYRDGRIIVTSPQLANRLVSGNFYLDGLNNFPRQVQQLFGASVRTLPGGIVLLS